MSVTALLVLATEAAGEPESSKALFYLGGALLAGWAVLLSVVGLSRPDFPATTSATRGIYGVSAALMAFTVAASILSG